ncbi:MAG: type II secretion system protein [Candidatus Paceibacterota bacterium]
MKKEKVKILEKRRGFVMVEMLVAVSLILLVLPNAVSVAIRAITVSSYQKNQMIATYLAEEGQELVRGIRDSNVLRRLKGDTVDWNSGFISGVVCSPTACKIDVLAGTLTAGGGNLEILSSPPDISYRLYTDKNGFYVKDSSGTNSPYTPTIFYRGVYVTSAGGSHSGDQVLVRSVVVWDTIFGRRKVASSGFLTFWLQ